MEASSSSESQKGKEKVTTEERMAEVPSNGDLLLEKFNNFIVFVLGECYPEVPGLHEYVMGLLKNLTLDSLVDYLFMGVYKHWPTQPLDVKQVRMIMSMLLARTSVDPSYPDDYKEVAAKINVDDLTDAQVDKIYRYMQLFIHIISDF